MKFKDMPEKQIFTWWGSDRHHTGVKVGEKQAFCFDTLTLEDIHHNKDVKELEPISETLILKFGRTGQAYLCDPGNAARVMAYRILLIGGEFMRSEDLKSVAPQNTGGEQEYFEQVYIMWNLLEKKLHDLNTLAQAVKVMLDDNMSAGSSDNRIMSTSPFIKGRVLTE